MRECSKCSYSAGLRLILMPLGPVPARGETGLSRGEKAYSFTTTHCPVASTTGASGLSAKNWSTAARIAFSYLGKL